MKKWIDNMYQNKLLALLFATLLISLFFYAACLWFFVNDYLTMNVFFTITILVVCLFSSWGILYYMEQAAKMPIIYPKTKKENVILHLHFVNWFIKNTEEKHTAVLYILQKIKKNIRTLSTRVNEFDTIDQHNLERLINKLLPELLKKYNELSESDRIKQKKQLLESLNFIDNTLTEKYIKKLNENSFDAFEKTKMLLKK